MGIVFLGDEHHRYFQEKQAETLKARVEDLQVVYWSTEGFSVFRDLDLAAVKQPPLTLIGSRHGAIPAVHWTARNPGRVSKLFLLHPSLHLNLTGMDVPEPHFVPTIMICHSKVTSPNYEDLAVLAGKYFHNYTLHLTSEPVELTSTLQLLAVDR